MQPQPVVSPTAHASLSHPSTPSAPAPGVRYTALQVAAVALPFVLATLVSLWIWQQVRTEARDIATRTTELLYEHIARSVEVQDAVIAAVRSRIAGMTWEAIGTSTDLAELLVRLDHATPNTNRIGIIDPSGTLRQVSGTPPPGPLTTHADRDFVIGLATAPADRAVLGRPIVGRSSGHIVLPYARPSLGTDGRPNGGVVWATLRPDGFAAMFRRIALGSDDTVLLVGTDGTLFARHPWIDPTSRPALPPGSGPMLAVASAPPAQRGHLLQSRVGGDIIGRSAIDGIERIYFAHAIPGIGAAIVYGRAVSDVQHEWLRRSLAVLAIAAMSSTLLLSLAHRSRRSAIRELQALAQAREAAEHRATAETARANAEAAMRQSQRVEMLGQIAAGIVHDFRNTMQSVHAGASLIERAAAQGSMVRVREVAEMLREAATRGGQLTQRLLSFRKGTADDSCDPAKTVASTCSLLLAALGPARRLELIQSPGLPARVAGSPGELDAAVTNLVINARDAMPNGGRITVSLSPAATAPGLPDRPYLELNVADTGTGMDAATLARATEAFFTTKQGRGTGLGLSSIRGFAESVGGTMQLRSTPSEGTTVTLWLPAAG